MIRHEDLEWLEIAKRLEINADVYIMGQNHITLFEVFSEPGQRETSPCPGF